MQTRTTMNYNNHGFQYHDSPSMMHDSSVSNYACYDDTCMTDMSMTSAWSSGSYIPAAPFSSSAANNSKNTKTASRRKSSGNLLARSKSVLFNHSAWSSASKQADNLDDESTYCHLSDDGMEVLAGDGKPEKETGKRLKRSGSLSNMLKTPSRLALRKSTSKLKLFSGETQGTGPNTPASATSVASYLNRDLPPLPPLPTSQAVSITPAAPSSAKSTKSLFARAVLRDRSNKGSAGRPAKPEQAGSGIAASQVQKFQALHEPSSGGSTPAQSVGKTPKQNWLGRLHIGKASSKKKVRLEIPAFESASSPTLDSNAAGALNLRDEHSKPNTPSFVE